MFDCPAEKSSIKYALHACDAGLLVSSAGGPAKGAEFCSRTLRLLCSTSTIPAELLLVYAVFLSRGHPP